MGDAWVAFKEYKATEIDTGKKSSADSFETRQYLDSRYMYRMSAAVLGIYGNSKEEAYYRAYFVDSDKQKLDGANRYTLRFAPVNLPPDECVLVTAIAQACAVCSPFSQRPRWSSQNEKTLAFIGTERYST